MFIRLSAHIFVAALAAVAAAAPIASDVHDSQCHASLIQCCSNTYLTTDTTIGQLKGLIGTALPDVQGLVGLGCTPITKSDAVCTREPVCCTGETYDGLVKLGCSPVDLDVQRTDRWHDGARLVAAALDVNSFFPYWFE